MSMMRPSPQTSGIATSSGWSSKLSVVRLVSAQASHRQGDLAPRGRRHRRRHRGHSQSDDVNEGIAVDTHVLRVGARIGLVKANDPIKVEAELMKIVPRERWTRTTDLIIFHGRKVCDARRPAFGICPIFTLCDWESRQAWAADEPPKATRGATARGRRKVAKAKK